MGKQWEIAPGLDGLEGPVHLVGRIEERRLDEQALVRKREEVIRLQALFEKVVEHILGSEVEHETAAIGGNQFLEAFPQRGGAVGDVFHDMGRQPDFPDAYLLITGQGSQGIVHLFETVIHPGKDMAMPFSTALHQAGGGYFQTATEQTHRCAL